MVVHHALRTARRAARVVEGEQRQLVDDFDAQWRRAVEQSLVFVVVAAGDDDADVGHLGTDRVDMVCELVIDDQHARPGVPDDVRQLTAAQARVESVEHSPRQWHTEVTLEGDVRVRRQHRHHLAGCDADACSPPASRSQRASISRYV